MEGWIKLYRRFLKWEWYNISEMVHLFIHLLLSANHEDGSWRGMPVRRGQLITGLNSLHNETGISIQTIRTCLTRLQKTGEINKQSNNQLTIITIINYESYQAVEPQHNKQTNKELTSKQQGTNNKQEGREEKEVKKFINPTLEEVQKYCKERGKGVDPAKWFNHYTSNGWKVGKNAMKDWKAAVHTWEKNSFETKNQKNLYSEYVESSFD